MPRKNMDYSRTIIYKIVCKDLNVTENYVGHTTDFVKRKYNHKSCCNIPDNKHYNLKIYQIIRNNKGWDNWEMIEIEKYSCNDANEARARERYWYETLNSTLNTIYPNRTFKEYKKEYNETNKEHIKETNKEWYETNKEKILEKQKTKKITCECGSIIRYAGKAEHLKSQKHINFINTKI